MSWGLTRQPWLGEWVEVGQEGERAKVERDDSRNNRWTNNGTGKCMRKACTRHVLGPDGVHGRENGALHCVLGIIWAGSGWSGKACSEALGACRRGLRGQVANIFAQHTRCRCWYQGLVGARLLGVCVLQRRCVRQLPTVAARP